MQYKLLEHTEWWKVIKDNNNNSRRTNHFWFWKPNPGARIFSELQVWVHLSYLCHHYHTTQIFPSCPVFIFKTKPDFITAIIILIPFRDRDWGRKSPLFFSRLFSRRQNWNRIWSLNLSLKQWTRHLLLFLSSLMVWVSFRVQPFFPLQALPSLVFQMESQKRESSK